MFIDTRQGTPCSRKRHQQNAAGKVDKYVGRRSQKMAFPELHFCHHISVYSKVSIDYGWAGAVMRFRQFSAHRDGQTDGRTDQQR